MYKFSIEKTQKKRLVQPLFSCIYQLLLQGIMWSHTFTFVILTSSGALTIFKGSEACI